MKMNGGGMVVGATGGLVGAKWETMTSTVNGGMRSGRSGAVTSGREVLTAAGASAPLGDASLLPPVTVVSPETHDGRRRDGVRRNEHATTSSAASAAAAAVGRSNVDKKYHRRHQNVRDMITLDAHSRRALIAEVLRLAKMVVDTGDDAAFDALQALGATSCKLAMKELLRREKKRTNSMSASTKEIDDYGIGASRDARAMFVYTLGTALWRRRRRFATRVMSTALVGKLVRKLVEVQRVEVAYKLIMEVESARSLHLSLNCYASVILALVKMSQRGRRMKRHAHAGVRLYRHVEAHAYNDETFHMDAKDATHAAFSRFVHEDAKLMGMHGHSGVRRSSGSASSNDSGDTDATTTLHAASRRFHIAAASAFAAAGSFHEAHTVLVSMRARGVEPDCSAFNAIFQFSTEMRGDGGRVHRGKLLSSMARFSVKPDATTYSHLCTQLIGDGMIKSAEAVRVAAYRRGVGLTPVGWVNLADGFVRRGHPRRALQLLREMDTSIDTSSNGDAVYARRLAAEVTISCHILLGNDAAAGALMPDARSRVRALKSAADILRHRIVVICLEKQSNEALRLHRASQALGLPAASLSTLQLLVQSLARDGAVNDMMETFNELRSSDFDMARPGGEVECKANLKTYTSLVSRLAKVRGCAGTERDALDKAVYLWKEAEEVHRGALDVTFFNSGLYVYARRGDARRMDFVLAMMGSARVRRDDMTHHCMIICYANSGAPKKLAKILRQMTSSGCRPSVKTFDLLVSAYARLGRLTAAYETMATARRSGCSVSVEGWCALIRGHCDAGDVRGAESAVERMEASGIECTAQIYGVLMRGDIACDSVDAAARRFESMKQKGILPSAYEWNVLVDGFKAAGMYERSWDLLLRMRSSGVAPTRETYTSIMSMFAGSSRPSRVLSICEIAQEDGVALDAAMYSILIKAYSRMERFEDARTTFNAAMHDETVFADIELLNSYLASMVRAGLYHEAEVVYASIRNLDLAPSYGTFVPLLRARIRRAAAGGDADGVFELYDGALERAAATGEAPPLKLFELMVDTCVKMRRWADVAKILRAMEDCGHSETKKKYEDILKTFLLADENAAGLGREQFGQNVDGIELLKFWLGLPNSYYARLDESGDEWKWW